MIRNLYGEWMGGEGAGVETEPTPTPKHPIFVWSLISIP